MNLYDDLYNKDEDFKAYVDKICQVKHLTKEEAFRLQLIKGYSEYIKENKNG